MFLRRIYIASGILSAASIVAMFALIIAQIVARNFNTHIPSSDDISGYLVVWATYFGLSYAMYHSSHIRVEIIVSRLKTHTQRYLEIIVGLFAILLVGAFLFYNTLLVHESFTYDDVTDGQVALPLWLVQIPTVIGSLTFFISVIDYTIHKIRNKPFYFEKGEML